MFALRPEPPIGGTYAATVTAVDHVLDAASGTFGVRLALPNPELFREFATGALPTSALSDPRSK